MMTKFIREKNSAYRVLAADEFFKLKFLLDF